MGEREGKARIAEVVVREDGNFQNKLQSWLRFSFPPSTTVEKFDLFSPLAGKRFFNSFHEVVPGDFSLRKYLKTGYPSSFDNTECCCCFHTHVGNSWETLKA